MLRKAIPFVLLLGCCLGVVAGVWAQDSGSQPSTLSDRFGQFRDFVLGEDDPPPNQRDARNNSRPANATAPRPAPAKKPEPMQTTSGTDWSADRRFRSSNTTNSSKTTSSNAKSARTDAPASTYQPYEYKGQYSDSTSKSQPESMQSSPFDSSRKTAQAGTNGGASQSSQSQSSASPSSIKPQPVTVYNGTVAGSSVMRSTGNASAAANTTTPSTGSAQAASRSNRSLQDKLNAAQASADSEAPPVKVPTPVDDAAKPATSSRRTAAANAAPAPTAAAAMAPKSDGPKEPVPQTAPTESAPAARVARSDTLTSSRRTATAPTTTPADAKPAPKAESSADQVLFSRQSPLVAVETSGPKTISVGKEATYTVTVQNAGEVAAQDVIVSIKVPEWADVVGAKPTTGTPQPGTQPSEPYQWRINRLEARSREQLALRLVPRQSRPFDLAVQWTFSPIASQTLVEVQEPKLVLDLMGPKEVAFGQTKVFRLTLSNPGTGDAENVIIKLLPLGDRKDTAASHQLGTLRAAESKVVEIELTPREIGSLSIRAEALADGGLRAEVADEVLVRRAGLRIDVEAPKVKYAGTVTTFIVRVANPGNATAENVQVSATLPPGAKYLSSSAGGQLGSDQNTVIWTLGTLRAGADTALEMKCALLSSGANRLQVISTAADELSAVGGATTQVEALADLKLEVVDPQGPVAIGEETIYEVHIRNRGTKTAEQIEVVSFFSSGLEPVSAQGAQFEIARGQVAFAPIASLAAGGEIVLKVKAIADRAGSHVFRTEVVCRSLESKLAAEETTRFYGDEAVAKQPSEARRLNHEAEPLVPLPRMEEPRPFPGVR